MTVKGTNTDNVRQYAAVHGTVRKKQIREELGLSEDAVKYAVGTLVAQGSLIRTGHGTFEFQARRENPVQSPVEDRIWRAMRVNPTFSAADIARQSGSTTSYVYKRFRTYRADGHIKQSGRKTTLNGDSEKVWRLTIQGKAQAKRPNVIEFKPDPIIEETITLNRLICSGRAGRDEESRVSAMELCRSIEKRLKEDMES